MSNALQNSHIAPASKAGRSFSRFVRASVKPVVFKLSRKLSVTYWPGRRRAISAVLLALLSGFVPGLAGAGPTGGQVVAGRAVVLKPTSSTTQVNQSSQNAIINWQSFSIGANEAVRFVQPSASAVALNRVIGADPSRIFGSLTANGKVFLVNSAGVYFAPGASVDVGGLVASSMNISNANFMSGKYKFDAGSQAGAVVNDGQLRGAFVVLAAPQVGNAGSIVTPGGAAVLAAGGRVSLDIAGDKLVSMSVDGAIANAAVRNSGSISADGGKVFMTASSANAVLDTVINTSGIVRAGSIIERNGQIVIDGGASGVVQVGGTLAASGAGAGTAGGAVQVLGQRVALQGGASIDVSGDTGGGSALIGGDLHGAGGVKTAAFTDVGQGAVINADALISGDGGKVVVWADQHTGFRGAISAKGGAQGGDGGFVETSGKKTLAFGGKVDTSAAHGATGTLLLDPTDITISNAASSGGMSEAGGVYADTTAATSNLKVSELTAALGSTNIIVDTESGQTSSGHITVLDAVSYASPNSLTLRANGDITVTAPITNSGNGAINLYGDGLVNAGTLTTNGGAIEIKGNTGGTSRAASITGGTIASNGGNVVMQSTGAVTTGNINSGAGTISVTGNSSVTINGALATTDTGGAAITVSAGVDSSPGAATGGDVSVVGGSLTVGAGGSATLYTGSIAGSAGVTAAAGAGSGQFRYNSAPGVVNYTMALGNGIGVVFREQPTLTIGANSESITYGDATPTFSLTHTGLQNGDTSGHVLGILPIVSVGGAVSGSGNLVAGSHAASPSGAVDRLGYDLAYADGTLTVGKKSLVANGSTVVGRQYDGGVSATVNTSAATIASGGASAGDGLAYNGDAVSVDTSALAAGTFADKNAGTGKTVTIASLALQGADAANYTAGGSTTGTIAPKALTATITASDKVYDGGIAASAPTFTAFGLVGTETLGVSGTATFDSKDVLSASLVTVQSTALADGANGGLAANYTLGAGQTATAHITPKALTASLTAAASKIYDGALAAATTVAIDPAGFIAGETVTATGSATFNSKDVLTANLVTLNSVVLADGAGGGLASNYSAAAGQTAAASITAKTLTATATAPDKVYDGTTAATAALSIASGLVDSETVGATGSGTFNSKDVVGANLVTVDTVALTDGANGGIATNYVLAAGQTAAANITPKALGATVAAPNKIYDGNTDAASVLTIASGLVAGETVTATGTATFNSKDVLTANLVTVQSTSLADGPGGLASNYSLAAGASTAAQITPKALTASLVSATKAYDGSAAAAAVMSLDPTGLVAGEHVVATGIGSFNTKDVLTASTVTVASVALADGAGGLGSNYSAAGGQSGAGSITPKALTVTIAAPDKTYDATTVAAPVLTITSGLAGSETLITAATGTFNSKDVVAANQVTVDTAVLTDGANGGLASNYSLASGQTTAAHITPKALTASLVQAADKAYDGTLAATATMSVDSTGFIGSETVTASGTGAFNTKDVLTANQVTVTHVALADGANGGLGSNYSATAGQTGAAAITPKTIAVVLAPHNKDYDGTDAASGLLSVDAAGLVGSETLDLTGNATYNSKDVLTAHTVTVNSVVLADGLNGGLASNYSPITGATYAATIAPKALSATASASDKIYDGSTVAAPTLTIAGTVAGETVVVSAGGTFNSKNVLDANLVTVDSVVLADGSGGGLASNYSLATGQTAAAHITPKALSATATAADKVYDGGLAATAVMNIAGAGLVGSETVTGTGTGTFDSKDVLSANLVTVDTVGLADGANGGLASNYSLGAGQTGTAHITPKGLTATVSAHDKVYDGNTTAASTLAISGGLVNAETVGVTGSASFDSKDVLGAGLVTVDSVTLADGTNGGLASNYSLGTGQSTAAHITPKALMATASASDRAYNGNTVAAPTLSISAGLVGAETLGVSGAGSFNSKDVLAANLVTVDSVVLADGTGGGLASNYSLAAGQTATAHITPKALSATAVAADKVYDGNRNTTVAINVAAASLVGTETVTATGTGLFSTKDANTTASLVTIGAVTLADGANGGLASNYSLGAGLTDTARISVRPSVAWIGAATGNWSDASNWEVGAIPDKANVANVVIPTGTTVTFNSNVPTTGSSVQVAGIGGGGALAVDSGTLTVGNAVQLSGYAQTAGQLNAAAFKANGAFNQTGGKLTVAGLAEIVQGSGTVTLADIGAANLSISGGAGVVQSATGALVVGDTLSLATGGANVTLSNKNNDFNKVVINSAHDVALTDLNAISLAGSVSGDLAASAKGLVSQGAALNVDGSTVIETTGAIDLDDMPNALHGKVRLTSGGDALLAAAGGLTIGGAVGGKLVLAATGPVIQGTGDVLHLVGASTIDAGANAITLTSADNHFGTSLGVKGGAVTLVDKGDLNFTQSTAGTLSVKAGGALGQLGALAVAGATTIDATGQSVLLTDSANSFAGKVSLSALLATVNTAGPLDLNANVVQSLSVAASSAKLTSAEALNVHLKASTATLNAAKALSIDGAISGPLTAAAGGAVTQTAALTVGGATVLSAAGQAITLANAGNDFGGSLTLTGANTQIADKNALSFGASTISGNFKAGAGGDVTQTGALAIAGTTTIDTTGALLLASNGNDFVGAVGGSAASVTLADQNVLTVSKLSAARADLVAGTELQMTTGGVVDAANVSLSLNTTAAKGAIGTTANSFSVKNGAKLTLGGTTPAVPAYLAGAGVALVYANPVARLAYATEVQPELFLNNQKVFNDLAGGATSTINSQIAQILEATQKKADSNAELIDRGLGADLTVPIPYPHSGLVRALGARCALAGKNAEEGCQ